MVKDKNFLMRLTVLEREDLRISAAFEGVSVSEYLLSLHEMRSRGEIMPGGGRIIGAALELADAADKAFADLKKLGFPDPVLRQAAVNLRSVLRDEGRPLVSRRKKAQKKQ